MTDKTTFALSLAVLGIIALGGTAAIAYFLGRHFEGRATPVLTAGLAVPLLIVVAAFYFVATDGADGPPPGNVVIGNMAFASVLTPVTLVISSIAVRFARRHRNRSGF